jgi:hypothetical protein
MTAAVPVPAPPAAPTNPKRQRGSFAQPPSPAATLPVLAPPAVPTNPKRQRGFFVLRQSQARRVRGK